jgi:hypothetical protein
MSGEHTTLQISAEYSVPISKLAQLIKDTTEDMDRRGIVACHFG